MCCVVLYCVVLCCGVLFCTRAATTPRDAASPTPYPSASVDATVEGFEEKWDKMDEFLKVMFTMTCKWKNGKDVSGAAAEKLKKGDGFDS